MSYKVFAAYGVCMSMLTALPVLADEAPAGARNVPPEYRAMRGEGDQTEATIQKIDELSKQIGALANELDLLPKDERSRRFNDASASLYQSIEKLRADVVKNHLSGTLYEHIVSLQCPAAMEEIKGLYL